jgi:aryl carrier-like protein
MSSPATKKRTAVVLRAWHDIVRTENLKEHVRSLIMELSLHSGAEYEVFLLTHIKDNNLLLYGVDEAKIRALKEKFIPREFWEITVLFNERTLQSWYPKVNEHRYIAPYP